MKNRFLLSTLAVVALLVAACGGSGATTAPTVAPATVAPATSAPTTGAASGATVQLASTELGDVLVDSEGRTLYGFTPDEATGEPTCYGDCAGNWPALTSSDEITVGEGLDDSDFSTVARTDDAGDQVKVGEYPLYYFAGDSAAGDTNGQGVGGKWFVVGADGELIGE